MTMIALMQRSLLTGSRRWMQVALLNCMVGELALVGCAHDSEEPGKPALSVKRGSAWASLLLAPPSITGPNVQLTLKGGELKGMLDGGSVGLTIEDTRVTGFGPSGPVNMEIVRDRETLKVDGMWNGGPVHLSFGLDGVRGSVIRRGTRLASVDHSCAYTLTKFDKNGTAVTGSSICSGMPQNTTLEIDPRVQTMLRPAEMGTLLVALLSAAPVNLPGERVGG